MTGWTSTTFADVLDLQRGHDLPAVDRVPGDIPIIGSFGVTGSHNVARYPGPGVAIGRSGAAIGRATIVNGPFWPLNTCLFVTSFKGNDPRWIYWLLKLIDFTQFNSGSAQPSLNRNFLAGIAVMRPPLAEQQAIAEVLGALDDKIAANSGLLIAIERLASTTYDSLPVAASQPLTDLANFVNGKAYTKGATGSGRVVIRIAELNSGLGRSTVYNDLSVSDQHLARPGDLLFAWSGSLTVRRWFRPEAIINQHIFKVIPREGVPMWLVDQALQRRLVEFKLIAADKATTMGHIQRKHLEEPVALPSPEDVSRLDPLMSSLWARALAAEQESLILEELRDTLLPELMSGRLRVRDAEKYVEQVV